MATSKDKKRKQLFDLFSGNLDIVKQHPKITLEPDYDDGYICPICMKFFPRESLKTTEEYDDYITLEDVPPIALGGKVRTLTCKICNNTAGTMLESHLVNKLKFDEVIQGVKNASIEGKLYPTRETKLSTTIHVQDVDNIYIQYHPKRSHPDHVEEFRSLMKTGSLGEFKLDYFGNFKQYRPEVALIRIAYLLAFSTFGYGFLISFNLEYIRRQIDNPQQQLLPAWGIPMMDYSDQILGINIITEPKELRSFLVVFDLKTPNRNTRHGVLLPGPTQPGLNIYKWLSEQPEKQEGMNIKITHIPDDEYLQKPELSFASHFFWKAANT